MAQPAGFRYAVAMRALSLPLILLLAGCGDTHVMRGGMEVPTAAAQYAGTTDPADPFERLNRHALDFNTRLDDSVLRPVAETYRALMPEFGRLRIRAFINNLGEPLIFANNVLQLRFSDAGTTLGRFALNTTLGGVGLFDVASGRGLARQTGDFGQTMARYGAPSGPYLMLPVVGPSNIRDALGETVDGFGNPLLLALGPIFSSYTLGVLNASRGTLGGVDLRAENLDTLDILRSDSLDYYARLRSVVRQRRDADLMVLGRPSQAEALDDPGNAPATLDDPGTASAEPGPQAGPIPSRAPPGVPPEWAAQTLRQAGLDAPGEAAGVALPEARPLDRSFADTVLRGARLAE